MINVKRFLPVVVVVVVCDNGTYMYRIYMGSHNEHARLSYAVNNVCSLASTKMHLAYFLINQSKVRSLTENK